MNAPPPAFLRRLAFLGLFPGVLPLAGHAEADAFSAEVARIFAEAEAAARVGDQGPELDRSRGQIVFEAQDGRYEKGAHFGKWFWPDFTPDRWGNYAVRLTYVSRGPKLGFQFYLGKHQAKGYVPPSGDMAVERTAELDRLYIPDRNTYPVGILSGDDSNGATFQLRRVTLIPAGEGEAPVQGIDGHITLAAAEATTYATSMRYEPRPDKNCLGYWTEVDDWAEWIVKVHEGGTFGASLFYGCGGGNEGSTVDVWVNDERFELVVEDTGGFQSWREAALGSLELKEGEHRVVIKPRTKTGKAVLDVQKIVLTPAAQAAG